MLLLCTVLATLGGCAVGAATSVRPLAAELFSENSRGRPHAEGDLHFDEVLASFLAELQRIQPAQPLPPFKGKLVLVHFWASWCGMCTEELRRLQNLYQNLAPHNFELIAIAVSDNVEAVKKILRQNAVHFPIFVDADDRARNTFDVRELPFSRLYKSDGTQMQLPIDIAASSRNGGYGYLVWDSAEVRDALHRIITDIGN